MKKRNNKRPGPRPKNAPGANMDQAAKQLRGLPTFAIVAAMNGMIDALRERGQEIRDWDEKDRVLQKITVIGNRVYALAPRK